MCRREEIEKSLSAYGMCLSTKEVAEILCCSVKKAFDLQANQKLKSFVLDETSQKKQFKSTKVDVINYILKGE